MGERSKTTPASNCREHEVPAPSRQGHSPPEGSEHWSGAPSFPAGLPAPGVCGSQGKDRQRCVAAAMPVIPGRKDVEVKERQEKLGGRAPHRVGGFAAPG